jgi:phenylpyruvate tautomerase PptA (4-oxalocrotonate tautomerase family)
MPIFHVELLDDATPPDPALPKRLADALGALLEAHPGHVWVRVSRCPREEYAENGEGPVPRWAFVRVILRALPPEIPPPGAKSIPPDHALAGRAHAIARIVAEHTSRALEDVHVYFDPPAAGRIAFGGTLVSALHTI